MDTTSDSRRRPKSVFRHRLPSLAASTLLTLALILSLSAGLTCNFLSITTATDGGTITTSNINELDGEENDGSGSGLKYGGDRYDPSSSSAEASATTTHGIGIFSCPPPTGGSDTMITLSRTFLTLSWVVALFALPLTWILTTLVPPTDVTWKILSILCGLACILSVPAFLMQETSVCKQSSSDANCELDAGASMLIVSTIFYAGVAALTAIASPPTWYEVREGWALCGKRSLVDGISTKFDSLQGWVDGKRPDNGLRYVGTRSTDGNLMMSKSLDDDDDARDLSADVADLEAGEFTGLTIEYNPHSSGGGGGGGSPTTAARGAAQAEEETPPPVSPITPAKLGVGGVLGAITGVIYGARGGEEDGDADDLELGKRGMGEEEKREEEGAVVGGGVRGVTSNNDDDEEVLALHPPSHDPNSLDDWTVDSNVVDQNDVPPSPSQNSAATMTDDEGAGVMVQLQTSRLDSDTSPHVVYHDRPPAYDLDSPYAILDDDKREAERRRKDGQQYWADEGALAISVDADDRGLVANTSRDEGDDDENGVANGGKEGGGDAAEASKSANNSDGGTAPALARSSSAISSPRRKLLEGSQNLRSTIRTLGRKLSTKLEGGAGAGAAGGGDPAPSSNPLGLGLVVPAVIATNKKRDRYYVAMSVDGSEAGSSSAAASASGMGGGSEGGMIGDAAADGNDDDAVDSELDEFVDAIESEDDDGGADADDEQTDDDDDESAATGGASSGIGRKKKKRRRRRFVVGGGEVLGKSVGDTSPSSSTLASSKSSPSVGGTDDRDGDPAGEAAVSEAAEVLEGTANDMDLSALLEEVIAAGRHGGRGISSDEEPPPPPPLPCPEDEFVDDEGSRCGGDNDATSVASRGSIAVEAGEMPDDEYEAYTTDDGSFVSASRSVPSSKKKKAVTTPPQQQPGKVVPGGAAEEKAEEGGAVEKKEEFSDPDIEFYTSASEAESSDVEVEVPISLDLTALKEGVGGEEDMPDDELMAYVSGSDGGSSLSSYTSGSSGGDSSLSSYGGDDSSLSSNASASEDEEGANMDDIVAGVLRRQEEKKRKQGSKVRGSLRDRRRNRRRKKKKRSGGRRRGRYSANNSVASRTSLLDETIEEETDMDLREMEGSSEEDASRKKEQDGGDPHEMIMTDLLVAGARMTTDKDLLNTIVETSFTKAGSDEEKQAEKTEKRGKGTSYESGYLSRSPASSDSESKPISVLQRIITPSSSRKAQSSSPYNALDASPADSMYHSAPETGDGKKKKNKKTGTPATVFSPDSILSPYSSGGGYLSDSRQELGNRPRLLGIGPASYSSPHMETNVVSDDDEEEGHIKSRRPIESTKRRMRTHSLPPVLHQITRNRRNVAYDSNDDAASLQEHGTSLRSKPMPTSWKDERRFRSPLHCPDVVTNYYSDTSSNTESSSSLRSSRSMRSSASRNRNARKARKKRLSMQGGQSPTRMDRKRLEPQVISPSDEDVKREKSPTLPTSHSEAVAEIVESVSQL